MKTPRIAPAGDAGARGEEQANAEELRAQRLDALGLSLVAKRSDAITARHQLGIDLQWEEDLEFYEGIDDANRGDVGAWRTKPPGQAMPGAAQDKGDVRSNVFVNITRPYCDAAAARIADMLMPTDDRAFSLGPTPVPELEALAKGNVSLAVRQSILKTAPNEAAALSAVGALVKKAEADRAQAKEKATKAQERIDDWFVECQYHGEVRKVIDDCAKLGTGVLKGPIPVKRRSQKVVNENGVVRIDVQQKIAPASRRIDPLNFFPDGACGENIHNGSYTWERDFLTKKSLADLRDMPGYLAAQIDKCIDEGPQVATSEAPEPQGSTPADIKNRYEVWYYHGTLEREDIEAAGCRCPEDYERETVYAIVTTVNGRVIKAAFNPLDTGDFPYDVMVWQRQAGKWSGIGVSRQIRTPQRMCNAATRNMMDNAGLSSGPQIVFKLGVITPADGNYTLYGRKVWYAASDADLKDLNAAFRTYAIESRQDELMAIIQFALKMAEEVTGLPLLLQGQQGAAPDTVGGMQIINNNASTVLRRLAKLFDDGITEPHVRRYYVWLMQYGENEEEKGDFQIDARGSSALVERDIQNQAVMQMGNIVTNPAFGVDPKKWFAEFCKSQRLDPKSFQYSEEDQKRIDEMAQQGPVDPRIAVAEMRAKVDTQLAQMEQKFLRDENERDRQVQLILADLENAGQQNLSLAQLKARLADTAMKLRTQRDLSAQSNAVALRKAAKPPTEPAGRAPAGQSFQR